MMNNRIGTVVLVVTTLLVVIAAEVRGQDDYGRIEVLGEWKDTGVGAIQAYGDTILREFYPGTGKYQIQVSYNGGYDWSFVTEFKTPAYYGFIPGIGSRMVGRQPVDSSPGLQEYWVVRFGRVVHRDTIGTSDKPSMLLLRELFLHPLAPNIAIAIGTIKGRVSTYEILYTSTDDGRMWREYELPEASQGLSRKLKVRVDYADSKYLFVAVNGDDGFGSPDIDEWYRLELASGELSPHPEIGILNNYWRPNSSVLRGFRFSLPSLPVLCDHVTDTCDTLRWSTAINQLAERTLKSGYPVSSSPIVGWYNEVTYAEGFHPQQRGLYVTRVSIRRPEATNEVYQRGVAVTTDTGRTWRWLMRPSENNSFAHFSIDPITQNIYMTRTRSVSPNEEYSAMLKVTPDVMNVQEQRDDLNTSVWPIPASESVTIRCPREHNDVLRVSDVFGRTYECSWFQQNNESTVLTVNHLPSGIYYVDVLTHERRWSISIVVHR